ncbi:hypothetical protein EYF80_043126 [Liparis tanakae]|uniref:Uncharacterized protein n=1 Tax=Liparis tanakae TaxID=230148 RepID=A0A4Z2FZK1_9TELE|nr:hypothetical protein EYF80_043126 [Liparis tanakae]
MTNTRTGYRVTWYSGGTATGLQTTVQGTQINGRLSLISSDTKPRSRNTTRRSTRHVQVVLLGHSSAYGFRDTHLDRHTPGQTHTWTDTQRCYSGAFLWRGSGSGEHERIIITFLLPASCC